MAHLYKSRLQNYAQKKNIAFPMYVCETQGPPHARQFKARVTVDGDTYDGPEFCSTLKDAEHAAAKVAFMSLSPAEAQEDDCLYKSLLQELAQKKGLLLPIYVTSRSGPPHMPCFISNVEIAGECFVGQEARTKKQAEMNAAKVAYTRFTEGAPRVNTPVADSSDIHKMGVSNLSSNLQSIATMERNLVPSTNKIQVDVKDQANYLAAKGAEKRKGEAMGKHMLILQPITTPESMSNATPNVDATQLKLTHENLLARVGQAHEDSFPGMDTNGKGNEQGNRSFVGDDTPRLIMDSGSVTPPRTKIVIRPHKPGMIYDGPIEVADNEWVAMKVRIDNDEQ